MLAAILLFKFTSNNLKYDTSIFSWHVEQLQAPDETFDLLKTNDVNTIFQYLAHDHPVNEVTDFIREAVKYEKNVYFLTGEPEWALDPEATELIQWIEQIGQYQSKSNYQDALRGIVVDVEPYLLEEFAEDPQAVMTTFVTSMQTAYKVAQSYQLEVIVCIPYYFDTLGFTEELELIIRDASDKLAVMNYYRDKEVEHLKTESEMSQHYNKPILNIYELQPPGQHDLIDQNTYYNYGIQAAYDNFNQLKEAYPQLEIDVSFHEYRYFKELNKI